ncbi:MAG: carotenoid oxygenase family protein [Burkholderiales bacterium]|nr:carotenoid oxygenase family protein [Burkholderiales bacterium]
MDRRLFFKAAGVAAAAGSPLSALLHSGPGFAADVAKPSFVGNLQRTPLRGFQGQDIGCDSALIEGRLPAALRGAFYRNGPGLFERGGQRYQHWFDGDGLVHAWRFSDHGVSHRARFVRTSKFVAESAAGEFLLPAFGSTIKAKAPVRNADSLNTANTSVIRLGDRLLAMWEGGSAYAMDPQTLETRGAVAWSADLKGMPFSAHPKVEADGTFWNFGTMLGKMVLYHLSPKGDLLRHAVFDAPTGAMVHDFAVSQHHLIFLLPPISLDREALRAGKGFAQSMVWNANDAMKVLVIDKADFSRRRVLEMPACMVFHFGNAWEAGGVIHVDFVKSADLGVMNDWMPRMMRGESVPPPSSTAAFLTIDLNSGTLALTERRENLEFPRVDPRFVAQRNRYVYYPVGQSVPGAQRDNGELNGVMRLDVESGKTDSYSFGGNCTTEEHVMVPRPGSTREGDGWLVGVGFDIDRQQTFASVFDAQNLAAGPMALARLPYWVPYCFHGNFHAA